MNPSQLVKGKKYNYFNSVINRNETMIYSYEQVNCYVFESEKTTHYLPKWRVESNINEII